MFFFKLLFFFYYIYCPLVGLSIKKKRKKNDDSMIYYNISRYLESRLVLKIEIERLNSTRTTWRPYEFQCTITCGSYKFTKKKHILFPRELKKKKTIKMMLSK